MWRCRPSEDGRYVAVAAPGWQAARTGGRRVIWLLEVDVVKAAARPPHSMGCGVCRGGNRVFTGLLGWGIPFIRFGCLNKRVAARMVVGPFAGRKFPAA